jgi:mannan endo-1,4-beta-mannosidase
VNSGKALDVSDASMTDGGNTQLWSYVGAANQQWRIENIGDGYYRLINRHSGKALDVAGGAGMLDDGANVQQWTPNGQTNQHWRFERVVAP